MMRLAAPLTLVVLALVLALHRAESRGAMWPDSPRYANAAAMLHDWLRSNDLVHPLKFAEANYFQYPAFNVPYHPPGYPGMVGLLFLVTGVSYLTMKVFVALCWAGIVLLFYVIQRRFEFPRTRAWLLAVVLLTTPELLHWSRDTMSEIPALFFLLASTLCYLKWLDAGRCRFLFAAFALFGFAFQCRVTVVGIFPAWILYALFTGRFRTLYRSPTFVILSLLGVGFVALWVKWVSGYARFEVHADGREGGFSWRNFLYFTDTAMAFLWYGNGLMLIGGALLFVAFRRPDPASWFWLAWLVSSLIFKIAVPTTSEARHFLFAIPAFVGLGGRWLVVEKRQWHDLGLLLCWAAIMLNLRGTFDLPSGLTGYEPIALILAEQEEAGNIFLACPHDQDLIFRYRAHAIASGRQMIRSDRTISTRVAEYAKHEAKHHVTEPAEVLEMLRKGRIRFVLATLEVGNSPANFDWELTLQTVRKYPDLFEEMGRFPLRIEFEKPGYEMLVGLFRFKEDPRPGPSELQLRIPTADMEIAPK